MNEPTTTNRGTPLQVSTMLPLDVRASLVEAALIDPDKTESVRRSAAINRATAVAKMKYPRLFR